MIKLEMITLDLGKNSLDLNSAAFVNKQLDWRNFMRIFSRYPCPVLLMTEKQRFGHRNSVVVTAPKLTLMATLKSCRSYLIRPQALEV